MSIGLQEACPLWHIWNIKPAQSLPWSWNHPTLEHLIHSPAFPESSGTDITLMMKVSLLGSRHLGCLCSVRRALGGSTYIRAPEKVVSARLVTSQIAWIHCSVHPCTQLSLSLLFLLFSPHALLSTPHSVFILRMFSYKKPIPAKPTLLQSGLIFTMPLNIEIS